MERHQRFSSSKALVQRGNSAGSVRSMESELMMRQAEMLGRESVMDNMRYPEASTVGSQFKTYPYGYAYPPTGYTNNVQLGLVTEHMLRKLDESRLLTMSELMRRTYGSTPGPIVEEPASPRRTAYNATSPGHGDWKGQINHIHAHLMEIAEEDREFRKSIGSPVFGQIMSADLEESTDAFTLVINFSKPREREHQPQRERYERTKSTKRSAVASVVKKQMEEEPQYEKENVKQEGTLKPYKGFNAEADAEQLRKAMKGLGTDEGAITEVMGKRTSKQRQEVIKMYKTMFGKDLVKDLKGELSGEYWKVVRALCIAPADYDASELRNAIKGLGTDDDAVIEIICTRTNKSLQMIQDSYKRLYSRSLEDDIAGDTSGHYQRLLISLLQANRDESNVVDRTQAKKDAQALEAAGVKRWGTDESKFNAVLVARGGAQLRATFKEYERIAGKSVEDAIKSEMSGDLSQAMLAIVRCVANKPAYFARQLHKSLKGLGTDDDTLIRIIVSRCEIDMVQIKDEFQRAYKQSLGQFIADDTSGDYGTILLALIGNPQKSRSSGKSNRISSDEEDSDY